MSTAAASAENTMFKKVAKNEIIEKNEIAKNEIIEKNEKVTVTTENENEEIHDSDDDMIVITVRETYKNKTNQAESEEQQQPPPPAQESQEQEKQEQEKQEQEKQEQEKQEQEKQEQEKQEQEKQKQEKSKEQQQEDEQKGEELFFKLKDDMEKKKLFPIMPCNMVSALGCAMEHVEYLDIKDVEREALAIELVKCLAYINNEYGARECFDYLFQNNMTDDIIRTMIGCTKNRYDINKYPHTNRNIMLSCVSLSKKVKSKTKPKFELLEELFDFKFSLCGLKRFFRIKDDSKNV